MTKNENEFLFFLLSFIICQFVNLMTTNAIKIVDKKGRGKGEGEGERKTIEGDGKVERNGSR